MICPYCTTPAEHRAHVFGVRASFVISGILFFLFVGSMFFDALFRSPFAS